MYTKKIFHILGKILLLLVVVALLLVWGYYFYEQWSLRDTRLQKKYGQLYERVETGSFAYEGREIHYLDLGPEDGQIVLLIHGAWGSVMDWSRFLQLDAVLESDYRFIVIDRIGYGKSGAGVVNTSIAYHSDYAVALLKKLNQSQKKPIAVGHSYGATIVAKMLMDHSDELYGGIVAAGAVHPEYEVIFPISYVFQDAPRKRLMGPVLWAANDEKLGHVDALIKEMNNFSDVRSPMIAIHGTNDSIVPYENALYLEKEVPPEYFTLMTLEGVDHPIQFNMPDSIRDGVVLAAETSS